MWINMLLFKHVLIKSYKLISNVSISTYVNMYSYRKQNSRSATLGTYHMV